MTKPIAQRGFNADPWSELRHLTDARIALGRAGTSLPTRAHLDFQLAHALARDAVHTPFEPDRIGNELSAQGLTSVCVASQASDRIMYLQRPDLGRRLATADQARLSAHQAPVAAVDLALIIADGLSALATHRHGSTMAHRLHSAFTQRGLTVAPIVIASGARVALADEIGQTLQARQTIILLGERPGLSSADSLGAYLTWEPRVGRHDAQRNCVSNIRPDGGLSYQDAAHKLIYLALQATQRRLSGVHLKDDSSQVALLS